MTTATTEKPRVISREEHAAERAAWMAANGLPASVRTSQPQFKHFGPRAISGYGPGAAIWATVEWDDRCGNGVNSFGVTARVTAPKPAGHRGHWDSDVAGGCMHEEIAKAFPEIAHLIKWHLVMADGPMHYLANVRYHAGDRDHWGLRKGEFRQHTSRGPHQNDGVPGVPCWVLKSAKRVEVYANEKPAPVVLEWEPQGITGEGKARELEHARSGAVWPEATDAELIALADGPKEEFDRVMLARLPALMEAFKRDVEALGFTY